MNKAEWKESDRFRVRTDDGETYVIIEETEYTKIKDYTGKAIIRGRTRYRTSENQQAHKIGNNFTFNTPFGPMFAERLKGKKE